jgi:hypothetical protein
MEAVGLTRESWGRDGSIIGGGYRITMCRSVHHVLNCRIVILLGSRACDAALAEPGPPESRIRPGLAVPAATLSPPRQRTPRRPWWWGGTDRAKEVVWQDDLELELAFPVPLRDPALLNESIVVVLLPIGIYPYY